MCQQRFDECRQVAESALVDDEAVKGVAYRHPSRLGIVDDGTSHLQVSVLVEISVHHPGTCLNDRYACSVANEVDEFPAPARYAQIDVSHSIEHLSRCLVCGRQQCHHVGVHAEAFQHLVYQGYFLTVGAVSILAPLEHAGIAAFEAERENVESDVGPGLVDHADDPEGHADTAQAQAVRQCLLFGHMAQGRG